MKKTPMNGMNNPFGMLGDSRDGNKGGIKQQSQMNNRSAFDSDDDDIGNNIRSNTSRSNVKIDYDSRSGNNQSQGKSNSIAKKQYSEEMDNMGGKKGMSKMMGNSGPNGAKMSAAMMKGGKGNKNGKNPLDFGDSDDSFDLGPNPNNRNGSNKMGNFNNFKKGGLNQTNAMSTNNKSGYDTASNIGNELDALER